MPDKEHLFRARVFAGVRPMIKLDSRVLPHPYVVHSQGEIQGFLFSFFFCDENFCGFGHMSIVSFLQNHEIFTNCVPAGN